MSKQMKIPSKILSESFLIGILYLVGMSIVRKLGRPKIRHCVKEYYRLYRSKIMRKYLTEKSIRYIIAQCKQGS